MDTFTLVALIALFLWLTRLTYIVGRIDDYLKGSDLCDDCRKAATVSAAESAADDR